MEKASKTHQLLAFAAVAAVAVVLTAVVSIGIHNTPANRLKRSLNLGNRYLAEQSYAAAIEEFEKAIAVDRRCLEAYEGGLAAYLGMEDTDGAQSFYDRALAVLEDADAEFVAKHQDSVVALYLYAEQVYADDREKMAEIIRIGCEQTGEDERLAGRMAEKEKGTEVSTGTMRVDIRATDIEADAVFNDEGYGSLKINGEDGFTDSAGKFVLPVLPQAALTDRSGSLLFPYQSTFRQYRVSGDIISLTEAYPNFSADLQNQEEKWPEYYRLDGSEAFALERKKDEVTKEGNTTVTKSFQWIGGPMRDGYAQVTEMISITNASYSSGGSGASFHQEHNSYIIDEKGAIVYALPEAFDNEIVDSVDSYGYYTENALNWCGEGLFAVVAQDFNWEAFVFSSEGKGYMDPIGNMVIDLSGQGYTDLRSFNNGLAVVVDADGMRGVIDKTGNLVIPCTYEGMGNFDNKDGLCEAKKDGKWGYIDKTGKVVIPFEYDGTCGAADGLAAVIKDGKCGLVDYNNQVVVPLEYDDISSFDGGVAYAIKDRKLYIIERAQ